MRPLLAADAKAEQRKQVVIVQGGPGTGKSVLAVNLLAALLAHHRNARYVSKNAAPRAVYEAKLTGTFSRTRISNLFSGSGAFVNDAPDTYDTYRTLMTRGVKGCYVYCVDAALAGHLRSHLRSEASNASSGLTGEAAAAATRHAGGNVFPLRRVSEAERRSGTPALPVVDLRFAAGTFSNFQSLEDGAKDWVAAPDWVRPRPGMFVAQVIGESMNRRIPNGAWCLFRVAPAGTREGKVVVARHRDIADPETGGRFTIKVYSSEKVATDDGGWRHRRITLKPDSDRPGYQPIVLELYDGQEDVQVIAEWLMVMPSPEEARLHPVTP